MAMWCHQHMLGDYKGRYRAGLWIKNDEKKKITINCFTPAASRKKKKGADKGGGFFSSSPAPNQSSKMPAQLLHFFPDLVTQLEKICKAGRGGSAFCTSCWARGCKSNLAITRRRSSPSHPNQRPHPFPSTAKGKACGDTSRSQT